MMREASSPAMVLLMPVSACVMAQAPCRIGGQQSEESASGHLAALRKLRMYGAGAVKHLIQLSRFGVGDMGRPPGDGA